MGKIYGTCYNSNGNVTDLYKVYLEYTAGTPNIAGNYTPLTVSFKVLRNPEHPNPDSAHNLNGVVNVSLSIDGTEVYSTSSAKIDTRDAQIWTFTTQTKNVYHDDDGTKTVAISASFSNVVGVVSLRRGTVSGSVELNAIARASEPTVSASSVTMLNDVTITTNRRSTSFTHDLTYSFGGRTGTIATGVGESYKWTVPDLVSNIPGKSSGICTITCTTKSGSTVIGTKTVTLTLNVPAKSTPSASASTVKMGESVTININRNSTGYTHKLTYSVGSTSGTIGTGIATSASWTPPKTIANSIGNQKSAVCTITCETYNGSLLIGTATTTITLTSPDATVPELSVSTVEMGKSVTISLPREADAYTHDLSYSFGGKTGTIATGVGASCVWTVPDLSSSIIGMSSGICTITCTTKNGSAVIGTATVTLTLTIPAKSTVSLSAYSVMMLNDVTITISSKSATYTHDLSYSFGGRTGTIATGVGTSCKWTVPDLVASIPGRSSGTCTITCKTKSGSMVIGTATVDLTLNIPAKSTIRVSADTVQMGKRLTIDIDRNSTGYTHTLTYAVGSVSGTIGTGVATSTTWTPLELLVTAMGNKLSAVCTITCQTYNGSWLVGTATNTVTLTVPDATVPKLSVSEVDMGQPITISIPKTVDSYTYDLSYTFAGTTGEIASGVSEDYVWSVPLSLASKIPSATEGTVVITCKTRFKDSTTVVGTETVSFKAKVPNNSTTQPKVTLSVSPASDLPSAFDGMFVAGKSKVQVSYNATSDYSTIKSYETALLSYKGSGNPYTSPILGNGGTVNITGKVTDARGYSAEKTESITVLAYSRPRILPGEGKNKIVCMRCNSDKAPDPGGVRLLIQIGRKYSKMIQGDSQKNYCSISYRWKTDSEGEDKYREPVELLSREAETDFVDVVLSDIVTSYTTAYNIQLIAEDDIGESDTVTITVPTAFATFHAPAGGHGFTLGGYHDPDKYDVFDCRFDAEFQGAVSGSVLGLLGCSGEIPEYGDANDYRVPGVWAVQSDAIAKTVLNLPPNAKAGLIRVYAATGQKYVTEGTYRYITQEYRSLYSGVPDCRRMLNTDGNKDWTYGEWVSGIGANVYTENGVETCQITILAGEDNHVLNLTPSGMVYSKNGEVLWTK